MSDAWSRGRRDESVRSPLQGGEPRGRDGDRAPDATPEALAARPPAPRQGGTPSPADEAATNQEQALESGEENPS